MDPGLWCFVSEASGTSVYTPNDATSGAIHAQNDSGHLTRVTTLGTVSHAPADRFAILDSEPHYGLSSFANAREILEDILYEMMDSTSIHNWDKKLAGTATDRPLEGLARAMRPFLYERMNNLLDCARVEEIFMVDGTSHVTPAIGNEESFENHLFFGKFPDHMRTAQPGPTYLKDKNKPDISSGRVIYIPEQNIFLKRASLMILHAFCIRIQLEDCRYIRNFVERHLSLRNSIKSPDYWQQTSPPRLSFDRQRHFKRVVISFHIAFLTLGQMEVNYGHANSSVQDRALIFPFCSPGSESSGGRDLCLFKVSSSTLLTLVLPEKSESREEEISLLRHPRALWTVLVVNSPPGFTSDKKSATHYTPIAQFVRGITASLYAQRLSAEAICIEVRGELKRCDDGSLFDDEKFRKSHVYHLAIRTCEELEASLGSCLKFIRTALDGYITELCNEANECETRGISYWFARLKEEVFTLEDLKAGVIALRSQAQENLHGATSVLEARAAIQQGDRMKTLAYLATIYLPLTTASSFYSISVLPSSANFLSFIIVALIMLLLTILLGLNLPAIMISTKGLFKFPRLSKRPKLKNPFAFDIESLPTPLQNYLKKYINLLDRNKKTGAHDFLFDGFDDGYRIIPFCNPYYLPVVARAIPALLLRNVLVPEIMYPRYQWFLFRRRTNLYITIKFSWWMMVVDVVRWCLVPAWCVIAAVFFCALVVMDVVFGSIKMLFKMTRYLYRLIC